MNVLMQKMAEGQTVLGSFVSINSPDMVEIMGISGFDFAVFDTEHGPMNPQGLGNLFRSSELRGMVPVARATNSDPTTILRVLDVGAKAIHIPQVNSVEAAENVSRAARYFPRGTRGMAMPRSALYGAVPPAEYRSQANEDVLVIPHCENVLALNVLEGIAAVEGVDMVFLGPFDMSQSLGIPGQIDHPRMDEVRQRVLSVMADAGKPAGTFVTSIEEAKLRREQGFRYLAYGVDARIFGAACRDIVQALS